MKYLYYTCANIFSNFITDWGHGGAEREEMGTSCLPGSYSTFLSGHTVCTRFPNEYSGVSSYILARNYITMILQDLFERNYAMFV